MQDGSTMQRCVSSRWEREGEREEGGLGAQKEVRGISVFEVGNAASSAHEHLKTAHVRTNTQGHMFVSKKARCCKDER